MRLRRWSVWLLPLALSAPLLAQWVRLGAPGSGGGGTSASNADLLEDSRDAGLLTDWHLAGRYGRRTTDFTRHFAPERASAKLAAEKHQQDIHYELVFADGTFTLSPSSAAFKGVYYAQSSTYLGTSGEWNVYLESGAPAVVFVDGKPVIERGSDAGGTLRGTIHAQSGYHEIMVKFVAQAAPFRVAILPPNSGSRRKNNTPYLQASPASEDMMARLHLDQLLPYRR